MAHQYEDRTRHLVIVRYDVGVIDTFAVRQPAEAGELAARAWQHPQVVDVQCDVARNWRGRRHTRVVL